MYPEITKKIPMDSFPKLKNLKSSSIKLSLIRSPLNEKA